MKLPAADWAARPSLRAVVDALDGKARYIGGAVRDTLLGLAVKDVDLATPLLPKAVMARLGAVQIKSVPTGIAHGTVTAVTDDGPVEITTLRRDVSTDGRRATVAFSDDWREDAARRDFTINALSADPRTGELFDYFGGLDDLAARRVRFIGEASERIAEDHLRIMRYFRFLARFGANAVDPEALAACTAAAASLKALSRERVADELLKLLDTADPRFAVTQMFDAAIFAQIMSSVDPLANSLLERLVMREQAHGIVPDAIRRLVALLPKNCGTADAIVAALKFSKKNRKAVAARLVDLRPDASTIRALAYHHGRDAARDIVLLFAEDVKLTAALAHLENWEVPLFPLTGGDLIELGLEPGPIVAAKLEAVRTAWIEKGFPPKEEALSLARRLVTKA